MTKFLRDIGLVERIDKNAETLLAAGFTGREMCKSFNLAMRGENERHEKLAETIRAQMGHFQFEDFRYGLQGAAAGGL